MATTTKNKTVIKAHRGMAHVPRGRRRPPMRQPSIGTPQMPRGRRGFGGDPRRNPRRNPQLPANFSKLSPNARKQFFAVRAANNARRRLAEDIGRNNSGRGRQVTSAQRDRMIRQMELARRRFNQQRRRRPTGTPIPQQKREKVNPFTPAVRQAQPAQEVRQPVPIPATMAAKGKFITKKNIGANDFREGGYVLSTVDNRKNKK